MFYSSISFAADSVEDDPHLSANKVDRDGKVVAVAVADERTWDFSKELCQGFILRDSELAHPDKFKISAVVGATVTFEPKVIHVCMKGEGASFTLKSKQKGSNVFYHYLLLMDRAKPPVVLTPECAKVPLKADSELNGHFLALPVRCLSPLPDSKTLRGALQIQILTNPILSTTIPPDQDTRIRVDLSKDKSLGAVVFKYAPEKIQLKPVAAKPIVPVVTPKKTTVSADGVIPFEIAAGFESSSHKMVYDLTPDQNIDKTLMQPQISAFRRARVFSMNKIFYDASVGSVGLGSQEQLFEYHVGFLYRFALSSGLQIFAGAGAFGINMSNKLNYGASETLAPAFEVHLDSRDQQWGFRGLLTSLSASVGFQMNKMEFSAYYRAPWKKLRAFFLNADYNRVAISPTDSGVAANYTGSGYGLSLGWRMGEQSQ